MRREAHAPSGDACLFVVFGASGDLTKRLLMPALYNLICDGLLPERFAIVGTAMAEMTSDGFREKLTGELPQFCTRKEFDPRIWDELARRIHYTPGQFDDAAAYTRLAEMLTRLDDEHQTGGNVIFYLATPPVCFGMIAENLGKSGLASSPSGWRRLIVEKPFGHDLQSAMALNKLLLRHFREEQIFRIDHYLGKETVQNLLAFRFSNGMFEPLWNKQQIDHIQFTVAESVGVEERGKYYDNSGALRDMIQNHMFQMLAYLCMEPPSSFRADAIRNEKAKVLEAVHIMTPAEVLRSTVRGQYGPGKKPDGSPLLGYRQEKDVNPESTTETFAALRLFIDNWRWEGVPIFLRSGKSLWKRGTEIAVQFKKAPEVIFRDTPEIDHLEHNQVIFHVQPDQGVEVRFQAKLPGPTMSLQKVNMRFDYQESFEASRGTGYEVLLYHCMLGDGTLFARDDLVEAAWRIAQPILDTWAANPPADFPNYNAGTWGPKPSFHLIEREGRQWLEVINRAVLAKVPLFEGTSPVFLHGLALVLESRVYSAGDTIVKRGDPGGEMYFLARGEVEVVGAEGQVLRVLGDGNFFGEKSLLTSEPRSADVRAKTQCDLFVLDKSDLIKVLRNHPRFAKSIIESSKARYQLSPEAEAAFTAQIMRQLKLAD